MKDIVEYIVKQFVSNPDAVEVNEQDQEGYLNILLKVAPEDMGLTIGKSGQTIKAIRRLLTIKAIAENVRVNLELVDSGAPRAEESKEPEESGAGDAEIEETKTEETPEKEPKSKSKTKTKKAS